MIAEPKSNVLYITYLGLLEPIPKSQVFPYLLELSKNVRIHLLSFEKKGLIRKEPDEFKQLKERLQDNGIVWYRLTYHKYPLILSSLLDILLGIFVAAFIALRHRMQIIHARSNIPIAIGYILKSFLPIRLLYDRRGIMGEDHTEHSGWKMGGLLYRLAVWFERKAIRKSDAVVVLTAKMHDHLKKSVNSDKDILIETIPCCIDLELFRRDYDEGMKQGLGILDKFVFIYSGSVGTYNLLNEMFDFFKEALEMIPNAHFLILTQNKNAVTNLIIKRKDISEKSVTVIYVPQEELAPLLSTGDVGLVFRRTSPTAIAASPTKFGEYLACGLPVISTPQIGDLEDIINLNRIGVVLNGHGKSEYKEAISKLLSLLTERGEVKKRCRKVAEEIFALEQGARAYLNIYNQLLGIKS